MRHVRSLKKLTRRIKQSKDMVPKYRQLEENSLHIQVFCDASFALNENKSSQLTYLILLAYDSNSLQVQPFCR